MSLPENGEALAADNSVFENMPESSGGFGDEVYDSGSYMDYLFENYTDGMEYPQINPALIASQAVNTQSFEEIVDEFNDAVSKGDKRISPVYSHKDKRRIRKIIVGGTDLVQYLADQMSFGITPIYVKGTYRPEELEASIAEAIWQNQMILEENIPKRKYWYWDADNIGWHKIYKIEVDYEIPDPEERKRLQIEMLDKAEEIIDSVGLYTNGHYIEELYGINNYIIDNGSYDHNVSDNDIDHTMQRKAYGILVQGSGVCSSYARAFQLVAIKAGFICVVDVGNALVWNKKKRKVEPAYHAWNMVCTEYDGNMYKRWMMVDPTWNDNDDYDIDDDDEYKQPRNTYLMIPKVASKRNRVSDGNAFSTRGKYSYISQDFMNFDFDYFRYSDHSASSISEFTDKICEYIRRGYVPSCFRCEWELSSNTMVYVCNEVHRRTNVSLGMRTTGYDAYIVDIYINDSNPNNLKPTAKGLSELKEVNGSFEESPLEYPGYMHGTKPNPEPEITEDERRADEEEAKRKQEEERKRQEEEAEKKRQEEERKRQEEEAEKKRQEEERKRQEEERKRQEEERKKKEQEEQRQQNGGNSSGNGSSGGSGSGGSSGGGGGSRSGGSGGGGGSRSGGSGGGGGSRSGGSSGGGGGSRSGGSSGGGGGSRSSGSTGDTKTQNNTSKSNPSTGWKQDARGWWYQNADGSYPTNTWLKLGGVWYLFNGSGYMSTGWQKSGNSWYYFSSTGAMLTDWVSDGGKWYYMSGSGAMTAASWVQSAGKWYYMGADGAMLRNAKTPDGYTVKADGSL